MSGGARRRVWWRVAWLSGCCVAAAQAAEYHVATNGLDTHDGLAWTSAWRTLHAAVTNLAAGDVLRIGGGTYREYVLLDAAGEPDRAIELAGESGTPAVITGSEVVTNWKPHAGAVWKVEHWPVAPQLVFEDGRALEQVGWPNLYARDVTASLYTPPRLDSDGMTNGTFYYDITNATLLVWLAAGDAPAAHRMEVAVRPQMVNGDYGCRFVTFRRLELTHANTFSFSPGGWSGIRVGDACTLEDCAVRWCDGEGLALNANARALRCDISHNGMLGLTFGTNATVRQCTIISNNCRHFNIDHHAGGMKIIPGICGGGDSAAGGVVEENEIAWNYGYGVWFDQCTGDYPRIVRNNYLHHNQATAVMIEVTEGAQVYNNLIVSNGNGGIRLSASDRIQVHHNTLVGNSGWADLYVYGIPRALCNDAGGIKWGTVVSNEIVNNVVYDSRCQYDLALMSESTSAAQYVRGNLCHHNLYYRPGGGLRFALAGVASWNNLADWQTHTTNDAGSLSVDPLLSASAAPPWAPGPDSPLVDRGAAGLPVSADFRSYPRPLDGNADGTAEPDIGAYESVHPDADTDGDGLRDTNELQCGLSPVQADTDHDGLSDGQEGVAGTDAGDAASLLKMVPLAPAGTGGELVVRWSSVDTRSYGISRAASLADEFLPLASNLAGTPPQNSYTDMVAELPGGYYRVSVKAP